MKQDQVMRTPVDQFRQTHPTSTILTTLEVDLNQDGVHEVAVGYSVETDQFYHVAVLASDGSVLWEPHDPSVKKPEFGILKQGSTPHLAVIQHGVPNLVYLLGMDQMHVKELWMGEADEQIRIDGNVVILDRRTYKPDGGKSVQEDRVGWDQTKQAYDYLE